MTLKKKVQKSKKGKKQKKHETAFFIHSNFIDQFGMGDFDNGSTKSFCVNVLSSSIVNAGTVIKFNTTLYNFVQCCRVILN